MDWQADGEWLGGMPAQPADPPGQPAFLGPASFGHDGEWEAAAPSAALALALETAAGPLGSYDGADTDALVGIARQWAALESWAASGLMAALRAMTREDDTGAPALGRPTGLPEGWDDSLIYEVAAALAMGPASAGNLAHLAWTLGMRLPVIGGLLARGTLTRPKARLVAQVFEPLSAEEASRAEALIVGELAGKTYPQVERLAWRAALAVAPDVAERRRSAGERRARVTVFREEAGTVGLSGRDLPAAEALAGHANVIARATEYEASGAFPEYSADRLRALAYLDLLAGIPAADRIGFAVTAQADAPGETATDGAGDRSHKPSRYGDDEQRPGSATDAEPPGQGTDDEPHGPGSDDEPPGSGSDDEPPGSGSDDEPHGPGTDEGPSGPATDAEPPGSGTDDDPHGPGSDDKPPGSGSDKRPPGTDGEGGAELEPSDDHGDDNGGGGRGSDGGRGGDGGNPGVSPASGDGPGQPGPAESSPEEPAGSRPPQAPRSPLTELTVPLVTLHGRAERAGDNRLLGPLDPALARHLAAAAARSPDSRWEIVIVDQRGYAIGHGIARPGRGTAPLDHSPSPAQAVLPARVNVTVPETLLSELAGRGLAARAAVPRSGAPPGDWQLIPGKRGTWTLTLPGGRRLSAMFDVVPTHDCDHRYQTSAYQPGDKLRRLVQVRDHECTFPTCSRAARESDFEHALPYDKGGRTDACNAGARSRRCHRVKQSSGWTVTQPKPGWHQWTTPTGRTYTQAPWRYIA